MHEIYDYVTSKPELDENLLIHYGIKGMKWKNHIAKLKNKASKIGKEAKFRYYRGKSKLRELETQSVRNRLGIDEYGQRKDDPRSRLITTGAQRVRMPRSTIYSINGLFMGSSGKANSYGGRQGSRVKEGIAAGRKRAAKKKKK